MKKLLLLLLIVGFYACSKTEPPIIPDVKVGQMWTRIDSNSMEVYIYDTLIVLDVQGGYATIDYNGWWLSVRPTKLMQSLYTYERKLSFDELLEVRKSIP